MKEESLSRDEADKEIPYTHAAALTAPLEMGALGGWLMESLLVIGEAEQKMRVIVENLCAMDI